MSAQRNMANIVPSVWQLMDYPIPRGHCDKKEGLFSTCSCKRFMQLPMNSTTSFDCDGCKHHASHHDLESPDDDAITRKWNEHMNAQMEETQQAVEPSRKRLRGLLFPENEEQMRNQSLSDMMSGRVGKERKTLTPKAGSSKAPPNTRTGSSAAGPSKAPAPRPAVTRAKNKNEARLLSENDDSPTEEMD